MKVYDWEKTKPSFALGRIILKKIILREIDKLFSFISRVIFRVAQTIENYRVEMQKYFHSQMLI